MYAGVDNRGNFYFYAPVFKAADGLNDDFIGAFFGIVFMKFDMLAAFNPRARVGGDQLSLIAFRHLGQRLFDTLHVDHHGIHRAGHQYCSA